MTTQQKVGSEREFDEAPNWREFQDFGSLAEVGGFSDCGPSAANRPGEMSKPNACPAEAVPPQVWTVPPPRRNLSFCEGCEAFPACGGSLEGTGAPGSRRNQRRDGTRRDPSEHGNSRTWPNASCHCSSVLPRESGISVRCLSALAPERFSRIQLAAKPGSAFDRNPAKTRGSVRFLRRARKSKSWQAV